MTHLHLHGGQKKTGTTALQAFLSQHHALLGALGIDVAIPARGAAGHHALMSELGVPIESGGPFRYRQRFRAPLLPGLATQIANGNRRPLILSSEIMWKRAFTGDAPAMFAMLFAAGITSIDLHIFVRSPLTYLNSDYVQVTKTMKVNGITFEQHADATAINNVGTLIKLSELAAIPGVAVRFHPYTAAVIARGTAHTFLDLIGIDVSDLPVEPRLNPSIDPVSLEAMRQVGARLHPGVTAAQKARTVQGIRAATPLVEEEAWLVDAEFESGRHAALAAMDVFTRQAWGAGWREVIPEEKRRRCNRFKPEQANAAELEAFNTLLAGFMEIARREGAV